MGELAERKNRTIALSPMFCAEFINRQRLAKRVAVWTHLHPSLFLPRISIKCTNNRLTDAFSFYDSEAKRIGPVFPMTLRFFNAIPIRSVNGRIFCKSFPDIHHIFVHSNHMFFIPVSS